MKRGGKLNRRGNPGHQKTKMHNRQDRTFYRIMHMKEKLRKPGRKMTQKGEREKRKELVSDFTSIVLPFLPSTPFHHEL